ncbi:MAG: hypothetical protein ACRDJU_03775 [Actinomycetota bacterium]
MARGGAGALINRRQFLAHSGALSGFALLASVLPSVLKAKGWDDPAYAQNFDLLQDTFNGLAAFLLPGDDGYSQMQGETGDGPGGVAAGTAAALIANLDRYLPSPHLNILGVPVAVPGVETVPLSAAVAALLNGLALTVNPLALDPITPGGISVSAFAHLASADKAKVFQLLEGLQVPDDALPEPFTSASGNLSFIAGIIPAYDSFLAGNEQGVYDAQTRTLTGRPVSWQISGYQPNGPVEGWPELKGYYKGRKKANP